MTIGTVGEGLFELGLDEDDVDGPIRRGYGGDAANTAVMAARLGVESRLLGRVGSDALGRALLAFWQANGVDTRWVVVDDDAPTGIYVNERLRDGGCRFHYHRRGSAGSRLAPADVRDGFFDGLAVVHFTGITLAVSPSSAEAAREAAARARARGIDVSFAVNHRPALGADPAALAEEARAADVVFVSLDDGRAVFETDRPEELVAALDGGPRDVVVTMGAEGALVSAAGAVARVDAPRTEIVDPSGAGDALAAVYLVSRLAGASPERALARAVAAASLSCRAYGCALSYPDAAAIDAISRRSGSP